MKSEGFNILGTAFLLIVLAGSGFAQEESVDTGHPTPVVISRPPVVANHVPVEKALENVPIDISVNIPNAIPEDKIILHFKELGRFEFHSIGMGYNPETRLYETTISEKYHSSQTLEYYIDIMPIGASKVRLPAGQNTFYEIRSYKSSAQYIRGILLVILALSPAIAFYMFTRMRTSHIRIT